jgi:hypothetical protein
VSFNRRKKIVTSLRFLILSRTLTFPSSPSYNHRSNSQAYRYLDAKNKWVPNTFAVHCIKSIYDCLKVFKLYELSALGYLLTAVLLRCNETGTTYPDFDNFVAPTCRAVSSHYGGKGTNLSYIGTILH